MATVADHYANLLAPIYCWMIGDFAEACRKADELLSEFGLREGRDKLAVDLGCGPGIHALALARRGYQVLAIDNSQILLDELQSRAGDLPIRTVHEDLSGFADRVEAGSAAIIVCMGDTLPHLASLDEVHALIRNSAACLQPGGLLLLSLRDYASLELTGTQRFIPVRSDEQRIHTCFLEYAADVVHVHDIVHARSPAGWTMSVSCYPKLRLDPAHLIEVAAACGLQPLHRSIDRGMVYLGFERSG